MLAVSKFNLINQSELKQVYDEPKRLISLHILEG